ncbi:MAG: peptidylprolyl isomerase [Candidatus Krumholzibacteriota bacterium]|nr:peptidylprolyl isomerase [Candidatus Krumholzibacteriota bacterium]
MRKALLILVGLGLLWAAACSRTERENLVVAKVDDRVITVGDFEKNSGLVDERYLPAGDDLEGKKSLLKHMINKDVMALKAIRMGYDKDPDFLRIWDQFKGPFMIAQLMDQKARKPVVVTEEEIDKYFEEMHYEYTLSQILLPDFEQAMEVRDMIVEDGEDFAEMARKYSLGKEAPNGGHVGSEVIGKMHWWVEEALFTMQEGEVSMPLKTSTGAALLKIHRKRKIVPDLDRNYAERRVRAIKEKKNMEKLKEDIGEDIGLKFLPDAVTIAYNALPADIPYDDIINYRITRSNAPKLNIPDQYRDMLICQYEDGSYTLADFEELYEAYALPERPRRQYGRESVIQAIHKKIFDSILPVYAEQEAKLLDLPEVKKIYDRRREQFMVQVLYNDQVRDEISATDMEIAEFYNTHKDSLQLKEERDYTIILLPTRERAEEIEKMVQEGQDFSLLARKFSTDPNVKENRGRSGLIGPDENREFSAVAFSLTGVGDVSQPFQTSRGWALVRVENIVMGELPTLEETKSSIRQFLLEQKGERHLNEKLNKWREDFKIEVIDNNLEKARVIRERPYTPED